MKTRTIGFKGGARLVIPSDVRADRTAFVVPAGETRVFEGRVPVALRAETVKLPRGVRAVEIELGLNEAARRMDVEGDRLPAVEITPADRLRLYVQAEEHDVVCRPVVTGRSRLIPHDSSYSFPLWPVATGEPRRIVHGAESKFTVSPPFVCRAVRVRMRAATPDAVMIKRMDMANVTFFDGPAPCGVFFDEGLDVRTYIMSPANSFALYCESNGPETWLEAELDVEPIVSEEDAKLIRDIDETAPKV